jgi:hypothetical protein
MADSTTTEVAEVAASTSSTAASVAKFAAQGVGLGILAAVGVDAYHGIKGLFASRKAEKQSQEQLEKDIELRIRRELDGKKK